MASAISRQQQQQQQQQHHRNTSSQELKAQKDDFSKLNALHFNQNGQHEASLFSKLNAFNFEQNNIPVRAFHDGAAYESHSDAGSICPVRIGFNDATKDYPPESNSRKESWLSSLSHSQPASATMPSLTGTRIYASAQNEFARIRKAHRTLAPTGCTAEFCQSGRMTRIPNEPRVGRDRPLAEIQQEAVDFLRECRDHGIILSDHELNRRITEALVQISNSATTATVTDINGNVSYGLAGGVWHQEPRELEYGLRASWRNSRRCIMRSEYEHLALCDLRHVTTSRDMARAVIKGVQEAFNRGRILPSVFVFPPRLPGKRGPMVWNGQILAFAGYRLEDGSILGDPANVDITESIIEFGWLPPLKKSRWDILPLVTMAEGEAPYLMELPAELKRTVKITHPRYEQEFLDLDLRWVVAPALSRLGFDIGGVQYTASPFIGWFMDAEIGVRNLADSFRYNVLPDVVEKLQLNDEPQTALEDLPEYLRMVAMSRAQAELNFAVYYSFLHEHVMMTDTMTSALEYQNFDDERAEEIGYRLPADPYWLAPPQGSIVPLWHRGGAPNYQPKPMICRHVQDPIKAWRRECPERLTTRRESIIKLAANGHGVLPKIRIFICSSGVNAGKMAHRLHDTLERLVHEVDDKFDIEPAKALNTLNLTTAGTSDIILIIASTTGRGEVPRNAAKFIERYKLAQPLSSPGPRFSCFANGDSTYGETYNAAAKEIQEVMTTMGCQPILGHCFPGDTAKHNPDWSSFNQWVENLDNLILGNHHKIELPVSLTEMEEPNTTVNQLSTAQLVAVRRLQPNGIIQITLDLGDVTYKEMDHLKLLPPNLDVDVERTLKVLHLFSNTRFEWHIEDAWNFLSRYVDLNDHFKALDWYPGWDDLSTERKNYFKTAKIYAVLESLHDRDIFTSAMVETICKSMPSIKPRLYSVACCPSYPNTDIPENEDDSNLVDVMVKVIPGGRFSDMFLGNAPIGAVMRFGLTSPDTYEMIQAQKVNAPFIAIATGSGIGPVRALLQRRLMDIQATTGEALRPQATETTISIAAGQRRSTRASIEIGGLTNKVRSGYTAEDGATDGRRWKSVDSIGMARNKAGKDINHYEHLGVASTLSSVDLFVGYKLDDADLMQEIVQPASEAGLFDVLEMVPSNQNKDRVQDHILIPIIRDKLARKLRNPACIVFVCANPDAADAAVTNLSLIAGSDIKALLGQRYIEEIFRG